MSRYNLTENIRLIRAIIVVLQRRADLEQDFRELRETLERLGLFKSDPKFHVLQIAQFLMLEIMAFYTMRLCGVNWFSFMITTLLLTTSQVRKITTPLHCSVAEYIPGERERESVHLSVHLIASQDALKISALTQILPDRT